MTKKIKERPTFIEEARRKQIVASAVRTIARLGMANTTLENIAEDINVSKGVISYHFSSKADLITAVFDFLISEQRTNRSNRVSLKKSPADKLREYIRADMDFYQLNRESLVCWWELWNYYKLPEKKKFVEIQIYGPPRETLTQIIKDGQAAGEFLPSIDPALSAISIEGSIEGVMMQWLFDESQIDLQKCGEELIAIFEKWFLVE